MQILSNPNVHHEQIEVVKVLGSIVLEPETEITLREKAVARLFHIIESRQDKSAILSALVTLRELGIQFVDYKLAIIELLRKLVKDKKYAIQERQKAWRVLKDLGIDEKYPTDSLLRNPMIWLLLIILVVLMVVWFWFSRMGNYV